jgi:uncharacterized protein YeaO (DUF488 family)
MFRRCSPRSSSPAGCGSVKVAGRQLVSVETYFYVANSSANLGTFQIGSPRNPREGLRVGTVRFLPRGVKKEDYSRLDYFDVWFPLLAPSSELLRWMKSREWLSEQVRWSKFRQSYVAEMNKTDARQAIKLLAELARATPLSIGCYCENESACHRSILRELIERAVNSR